MYTTTCHQRADDARKRMRLDEVEPASISDNPDLHDPFRNEPDPEAEM